MVESNFQNTSMQIRVAPAARMKARKEGIDLSRVRGSGPGGIILTKDIDRLKVTKGVAKEILKKERIYASTLARRLGDKKGISLETVKGTGIRGRIMMADVKRALESTDRAGKGGVSEEKEIFGTTIAMTQMRKVIAKRMAQSAFTAPHIYFFADVEVDALILLREKIIDSFEKEFKVRLSINDFLIKSVAMTIREFPMLNAMLKGENIYIMPDINIGLAIAVEEGLIVPAILQADRLGLGKISQMRSDLVERARTGKLKLEEIERGTFTISSLAQFDILFFTAILNPPQSGILSVGKNYDQLALKNGQVVSKKVARLGLSVDHRIIDGALAATFLQSLKNRLENPILTFMHLKS